MQHTHAPTDGSAFDAISFVLQVILEGFCIPAGSVGQRTRMERPVEQVAQLLEKKATFLRGVKSLAQSLSTLESAASLQAKSAEVFNLVKRTLMLLRSRFSAPDYWRGGLQLVVAAQRSPGAAAVGLGAAASVAEAEALSAFEKEATAVLGEEAVREEAREAAAMRSLGARSGQAPAGVAAQGFPATAVPLAVPPGGASAAAAGLNSSLLAQLLGDMMGLPPGLLGAAGGGVARRYDDVGIVVDDVVTLQASQGQQQADAEAQQQQQQDQAQVAGDSAAPNSRDQASNDGDVLQALGQLGNMVRSLGQGTTAVEQQLEAVLSVLASSQPGGGGGAGRMMFEEEQERMVEALAEQFGDVQGLMRPPAAPPMSKRLLSSLPVLELTAEKVEELGGPGSACPVCIEPLAVGDKVVVLPCKGKRHAFHPPCLKPWADKTNTCPVCREELPTDDWHYEAAKERAAEEAAEREGARNAAAPLPLYI